jgi:phosphoribulokinase
MLADGEHDGLVLTQRPGEQEVYIPGWITSDRATLNRAEQLEEVIWSKMHFARHLRKPELGEFTIGTQPHRSDSLAIVQLLILYHVLTARQAVSLGSDLPCKFDANVLESSSPAKRQQRPRV